MAKLLKLRRGTTTQHASFTGAEGEVTIDTTKDTVVVHDGSQAGGKPLARQDMSNVPAGTILGTQLENSGVTGGQYGSSSAIPIVTIDNQGLVTAASTTAIDSTKIQNGSSEVSVANNGAITSNANHDFSAGIDVTGNISCTGTVDGVDIAAKDTLFSSLTSSSGVLTNGVTATTQAQSDNSTKVSTTAYVRTAITEAKPFPTGTKMLFQQTSAPTGWTKVTSGVDNKALRVVSGTAGSGGTNTFTGTLASRGINANAGNTTAGGNVSSSAGNTTAGGNVSVSVANAAQGGNVSIGNTAQGGNVSISNVSTSGTVNSHTLSVNQMPSHSHSTNTFGGNPDNRGRAGSGFGNERLSNRGQSNTNATGGNGGHSHGFSGSSHNHNASFSGSNHNHNASFSGSNHSHNANASFSGSAHNHNVSSSFSGSAHNHSISVGNLDMEVQYLDVIIAAKD